MRKSYLALHPNGVMNYSKTLQNIYLLDDMPFSELVQLMQLYVLEYTNKSPYTLTRRTIRGLIHSWKVSRNPHLIALSKELDREFAEFYSSG